MLEFFDDLRRAVDPTSRGTVDENAEGYMTEVTILQGFGWREVFLQTLT